MLGVLIVFFFSFIFLDIKDAFKFSHSRCHYRWINFSFTCSYRSS